MRARAGPGPRLIGTDQNGMVIRPLAHRNSLCNKSLYAGAESPDTASESPDASFEAANTGSGAPYRGARPPYTGRE